MKKLINYSILFLCSILAFSCEIDNYDGPDATIKGTVYDHIGNPLQVSHGSGIIRMREISWAKDETSYIGNQTLLVQQDGTYQNTKWFSGTYLMLPRAGAFYPYDDAKQDADDAGETVEIKGTVTKDFSVTPYLTIEWVKTPVVVDGADGKYLECSVRFKRNQKAGYEMPDVKESWLLVSRSVNTSARLLDLYPVSLKLTNDMEGQELSYRTAIPLKYTGIDYWIRVSMNCQTATGKPETNYPGMGSDNFTTIEKIHVP
ncbi:MAG: DUF3823 domain-containing protein [Dysgonamonadaceae bacterium]|jgi:hypothetical protein|nr:DUF3823 domain-containing protein [Dysgonamonadaceae bacterium]